MEDDKKKPGNYLALDGGLSGLSGLFTLEELFSRLKFDLKLKEELAPWRHFKVVIGTAGGGLVAIFVGRLRMPISKAIESYIRLLPILSVSPAKDDQERKANTEKFNEEFLGILSETGYDSKSAFLDEDAPKTVVVTSNVINPLAPHFIRSYQSRGSPAPACTILQAACACIASQDQFLPVIIGEGHRRITLIDALAGYANPTKELMREAQLVFGEEAEVSAILSLGAGKIDPGVSLENSRERLFEVLKRGGAVCEQTHEDMQNRLSNTSVYFRFNVEKEMGTTLDIISTHTSAYLQESLISRKLDKAAKSIHRRLTRIKLKDINSVATVEIQLKPRPSLVPNFVGREDILEAIRLFHFSPRSLESTTPAITVLSGLGGSGKTQISLKFAQEFERTCLDVPVYFLNAESEASLKSDYETLIRSVGPEHHSQSHDDALVWLATKLKNWLLIIDNADNPSLHLFSYLPKCAFGNIIITTRNSNHSTLAPSSSHHVEGLSESDSVTLILESSGYECTEQNRALATEIVRELGNLPLALAQAAGYISVHKRLSSYLSIYRRSAVKILAFSPSQRLDDYPLSVVKTIEMALDHLPQEVQDVMRLLAHLDSTSIPHSILVKAAERRFEHVTWTTRLEIDTKTLGQATVLRAIFYKDGEWSDVGFDKLVTQCLQYSLLRITTQGEDSFYSMHILVRSYLQTTSAFIQGHPLGQLVVRLLGSSVTYSINYKHLAFHRLILPHLKLIRLGDVVEAGDQCGFWLVFYETGDEKQGLNHLEKCVEIWKTSLGDEHENTLSATMNLAISYKALGRIQEALELEEQVLILQRKLLGPEHLGTLKAMHNLAESYQKAGRKEEAMKMEEQVLEVQKRTLGPDDPITLRTMNNLAVSFSGLGRTRDALELDEQVLETRRKVLGPEHPDILTSMSNLAHSYSKLGRQKEAMMLREQVVELRTKVLGLNHPRTANAMWNLACSLRYFGLRERHLNLLQTAVPVHEKAFGTDHWKTIRAREELDKVLLGMEDGYLLASLRSIPHVFARIFHGLPV